MSAPAVEGKNVTGMLSGVDQKALLADLRKQVTLLEVDLRQRSEDEPEFAEPLSAEYRGAREAKRTAATFEAWRDERITQVAAAWVLGTVFVRFCEDNDLIDAPFIAGSGERLADAEERHEAFFKANPAKNDRDWLTEAFNHLAATNDTAAGLFDPRYNPLWEITPSFEAATALLAFWRRRGPDGEIVHDFTDPSRNTRFLGDLYQDLSEHARKTYALLQTPEFVEEFILDLTLTPAIEEFDLAGLRTIDPACGSGHFLLGIFHRLVDAWREAEPGTDDWELIRRALESVHGCDKNPFATSIARFRLLIAALVSAGEPRLSTARSFPINVAVGDSLLHGRGAPHWQQGELFSLDDPFTYRTEDVETYIKDCDLLGRGSYHVVVGNPPYITPKDKQENENYRIAYKSCSGTYALSVPFAECLFQLAIRTSGSDRAAGYVGQITANSFMNHEFGKNLIERFFPSVNLTHVIDTSGANIPGHGTPTVVLVGRNELSRPSEPVRMLLGVRAGISQPGSAPGGVVWAAILKQIHTSGSESDWIASSDQDRTRLGRQPWPITGGSGWELVDDISSGRVRLKAMVESVGYTGQTNSDGAFLATGNALTSRRVPTNMFRHFLTGTEVREYQAIPRMASVFPYDAVGNLQDITDYPACMHWLWPSRTVLEMRATFGGSTYRAEGRAWWGWHQVAKSRLAGPVLTWPFVQTGLHFVYLRECMLHNRHAPVVKLLETANNDDHFALLGVLNSSTACFWMRQVSHNKGEGGGARVQAGYAAMGDEAWKNTYEFSGTKLQEFPLPGVLPLHFGRALDSFAQQLSALEPSAVCEVGTPNRADLDAAHAQHRRVRARMIATQEELDWHTYGLYSLLSESESAQLVANFAEVPEIALGERAFEIVLARKVAAGELDSAWFTRHGSTPITEIPAYWPQWYQDMVRTRIEVIKNRRDIGLIERPECKRRWSAEPWERKEERALRNWLLDRCEREELWFALRDGVRQPRALTVNQLADQLRDDEDFRSVAALYATDHLGKPHATLATVLDAIVADQHVPYLAALRYSDTGLRKRDQWERVWELQREEDRTGKRLDIAVPPKYNNKDFRKNSYWSQRGKLDVPKERFISYPDASPEADTTLLLGWAGWDHKDQAQTLVNIVNERTEQAGWDAPKLTPLLAGLAEVMPWVKQWHAGYDDEWGGDPAEEYQVFLDSHRATHQLTEQDLTQWRPAVATRGRKASTRKVGVES